MLITDSPVAGKITSKEIYFLFSVLTIFTLLRYFLSQYIVWVMIPDSAWYASSAQSFFESFRLLICGKFNAHSMPLYSILISPAYYFTNIETNFLAIKFVNSLVMSSTVIPVYLLAKEFLSSWPAKIAALLSILIGPMFYTFTIMSENLHYPLVAWSLFFIYKSLSHPSSHFKILLGIFFGLALLNKMSSLALVVSYCIILLLLTAKQSKGMTEFVKLPINYLKMLFKYKYVFIMLTATVVPYLFYRKMQTIDAPVPYGHAWTVYATKIMDFDITGYLKWLLIYIGQLNLSTGLFLLVPALLMIVSYIDSSQKRENIFGVTAGLVILCVMMLAAFQSGYNLGRLNERHFFAISPVVFILFFVWLDNKNESNFFIHLIISFLVILSTYFALFKPSWTHIPASDSAFADTLAFFANKFGIAKPELKKIVFSISVAFILSTHFKKIKKLRFIYLPVIILFLVYLSIGPYSLGHNASEDFKKKSMSQLEFINQNIHLPANIIFISVPREIILDHIIWNKDYRSNLLFEARPNLEGMSPFKPSNLEKLHKLIKESYPTYLISSISNALLHFDLFYGEEIERYNTNFYLYKISEYKPASIKSFLLDFGNHSARQFLKNGWDKDEGPYPDMGFPTFVWAVGNEAVIVFPADKRNEPALVTFRAMTFYPEQSIDIEINGEFLRTVGTTSGWNEYTVRIPPSKIIAGDNRLAFKFKIARSPAESGGKDKRKLAVAFDWLTYR